VQLDPVHGGQRKHPAFTVWRAAVATADGLSKQFGLTPASRARLLLDEPDTGKSLAEMLFEDATHD
jgi:phage terminase small subunit